MIGKFPVVAGFFAFLVTVTLLAFGVWAPETWIGARGYGLGYSIYASIEFIAGAYGFTQDYQILLGWPLRLGLILFPFVIGSLIWALSMLLTSFFGAYAKRRTQKKTKG